MKTDDLIRALAADMTPRLTPGFVLIRAMPVAVLVSLVALWAILGPRADLGWALTNFPPLLRHILVLLLFATAFGLGRQMLRPDGLALLWVLSVPLIAAAAVLAWGLLTTPPEGWSAALMGKTHLACVAWIPILSVPPVLALFLAFRQGAPVRPALMGALAGLAGGSLGAAIYALHCTEDSPLFFVIWYSAAIGFVTAVSAFAGARMLRW